MKIHYQNKKKGRNRALNQKEHIELAEQHLLKVYQRFPLVLERGEGVYLYDVDGKKYLDFAAGIGVCALGYGHPVYNEAIKQQVDKLLHTSNLFYNQPLAKAARSATRAAQMERVFFTNSGAEAIEGALKVAKKYAYLKDGHTDHEIIAMEHSFHGRTLGALSITGNAHYREPFEPLAGKVKFAKFNDLASVTSALSSKTSAIILEPVQGEGGIYPIDPTFFAGVQAICKQQDILLILDEIQCGMGRTGAMFAWQHYGIKPDIMTSAKALGGGLPVGAFFVDGRVIEHSLVPGDHGTTYGMNPLVGVAVEKVLEIFTQENILDRVNKISPYLEETLEKLVRKYQVIEARRGLGLMQGIVLASKAAASDVVKEALAKGLIVLSAGGNVLRLLPPLVIEKEHIDEMYEKMDKIFSKL
jgi:acetylornithine/N-succinyldiaminopimelate aminotransferase